MRDPRVDQVADAIEQRYPGTIVVISPCPSPDDPDIDWMLDVLNLQIEHQLDVVKFAFELSDRLFAGEDRPFLVGGVTPEWTALHYAKYLHGEPARP
jgi:hypothetical protein